VGLLRQVLAETPVRRLRLSSIEPMDWTDDLIELMSGEPRIARHVHAPLQSGSDTVLRRMYRKYRPRHYRDRIETAHQAMPDAAFGADVMTGFPGETDAEFSESVAFIESLPLTYLHVFTYSERPGTRAAEMAQVPMEVRRERTRILRELSDRKTATFRRGLLGRTLSVVTLGGSDSLASNYVPVRLAASRGAQQIVDVTVHGFDGAGMSQLPGPL
jgi:threonylcarbamoyladenosine tRNA methylthiotransferase MtaB